MANGVKIKYGDVAPEAKENFVPSAENKAPFVDLTQLNQYNLRVGNYANPCELYQTILDGSTEVFPEEPAIENMGYWSDSISGTDGSFTTPIVLTFESVGNYSSQGITFTFDTNNNIFCNSLNIKWYQDDVLLKDDEENDLDIDFTPNSAFYFCRKQAQYYNKVVITFNSLNLPYNRIKLRSIDYGYGTYFYGDELRNVKLIQEIDPISKAIPINTCDFTLDSRSDMEYSFQAKQPLSVFYNDELKATVFVEKSKRTAKRIWSVNGEDYTGILDGITFMGGMYNGQDAYELFDTILTQAKVPHTITENLQGVLLYGHIPICSCREAIQHICFATCTVADTSNSEAFNVDFLPTEESQTVEKRRIRQGQNFEDSDRVTEVQVAQHSYIELTSADDIIEAYNASESGTGENILVEFSEPLHSLTITNGTINKSGANYAIITTTNSSCILSGKGYKDNKVIKSQRNPNILVSDLENIKKIENETLVSSYNITDVLQKCFDYYSKTTKVSMQIEDGKHIVKYGEGRYGEIKYGQYIYDAPVNVGEIITAETEYLGTLQGRITSARFSLNGGIVLKECEVI